MDTKLDEREIRNIFRDCNLWHGRCISYSKSEYRSEHPNNICVFNAAVFNEDGVNIWNGDLDITKDGKKLQTISSLLGSRLFILRESDAFYENNYTIEAMTSKAVWKTEA